jgi:metal-responsive CopG/Arc/MetJ family transcriptional regulator
MAKKSKSAPGPSSSNNRVFKTKSISIHPDILADVEARMEKARIHSFSEYIASLIREDLSRHNPK